MAPRIRTLKPDCWQDAAIGRLSIHGRLLFVGLITQADDDGRLSAEPALLRAQIFPYDAETVSLEDIDAWLADLANEGLILQYVIDRNRYVALPSWPRHQRINRKVKSRIPEPREEDSRRTHGGLTEDSPPEGKGVDRSGVEGSGRDKPSTVVARFKEAATVRKIEVKANLITQALADYQHVENRERVAFDCAAWLRENAQSLSSTGKARSAHLTLRTFLKRAEAEPKAAPGNIGTTGETDPVEGVLPNYSRRLGRTEDELRPVVAGLFAKTGSTPLLPEVHKALEAA